MQKLTSERDRIWARHEVYLRERMKVEISDRQYLWWDWVFTTHMESAVAKYLTLIFQLASRDSHGCLWFGDHARANIKFQKKTLTAYRFAYGIATVVPLSQTQLMRHECNNPFCVNPRHLLTGDQKDNFRDHLATQAYGTRWELLRGWDSM
ncbi:hypothetical protein [Yoonia sp. R78084]|uniref:hypothetical protein n=1 Tax=Yoonia sp. R78084 TaxID=3093869 RepID=UPI0037DC6C60